MLFWPNAGRNMQPCVMSHAAPNTCFFGGRAVSTTGFSPTTPFLIVFLVLQSQASQAVTTSFVCSGVVTLGVIGTAALPKHSS